MRVAGLVELELSRLVAFNLRSTSSNMKVVTDDGAGEGEAGPLIGNTGASFVTTAVVGGCCWTSSPNDLSHSPVDVLSLQENASREKVGWW